MTVCGFERHRLEGSCPRSSLLDRKFVKLCSLYGFPSIHPPGFLAASSRSCDEVCIDPRSSLSPPVSLATSHQGVSAVHSVSGMWGTRAWPGRGRKSNLPVRLAGLVVEAGPVFRPGLLPPFWAMPLLLSPPPGPARCSPYTALQTGKPCWRQNSFTAARYHLCFGLIKTLQPTPCTGPSSLASRVCASGQEQTCCGAGEGNLLKVSWAVPSCVSPWVCGGVS